MERLKDALEKAREERERVLATGDTAQPSSDLTGTYTGEQLARLVTVLNSEHQGLSGIAASGVSIGESTLGVDIDLTAPDLEATHAPLNRASDVFDITRAPSATAASVPPAPSDDALRVLTRTFEDHLRDYVDAVRQAERDRVLAKARKQIQKLKKQAEDQLREKLRAINSRYAAAYAGRDADIRKRYAQLLNLANRLAQQKGEINRARQLIDEKLKRAEQLHRELTDLGGQVSTSLDELDDALVDDGLREPWPEGGSQGFAGGGGSSESPSNA